MTTTITPEQADTLPAEAVDLDALAELAKKATPGPWTLVTSSERMRAGIDGSDGRAVVWNSDREWDDDETGIPRDEDASYIAALDPTTVLALIDLARRADDHYFAVDYTGCIHEAPDRETAIKWADDFARTANGGAIGSERPEVAKTIGQMIEASKARVAAMTPAEREEMYREQRESFVRGMRACEHGVADWEDCPQCRSLARRAAVPSEGDYPVLDRMSKLFHPWWRQAAVLIFSIIVWIGNGFEVAASGVELTHDVGRAPVCNDIPVEIQPLVFVLIDNPTEQPKRAIAIGMRIHGRDFKAVCGTGLQFPAARDNVIAGIDSSVMNIRRVVGVHVRSIDRAVLDDAFRSSGIHDTEANHRKITLGLPDPSNFDQRTMRGEELGTRQSLLPIHDVALASEKVRLGLGSVGKPLAGFAPVSGLAPQISGGPSQPNCGDGENQGEEGDCIFGHVVHDGYEKVGRIGYVVLLAAVCLITWLVASRCN